VLGLRHKHGTKMRYLAGCRCWRCRRGNAEYERKLNEARKLYGPNDLVSSARVLAHLLYLKTFGIGHKTIAKHARVAKTGLAEIIWSSKQHIRRRSEARILAIQPTLEILPRNVNIPVAKTMERIKQLIAWGYPKSLISQEGLGNEAGALQVNHSKSQNTTVRTALAIRSFYDLILTMRRIWQEKRGPIPTRQYVYWNKQRGRRPAAPILHRLELRNFAATYDYVYLWPKELKEASLLKNKLIKLYRERNKNHGKKQAS
jgi:hypothetical protein